jgi:hypothetical protein
MNRCGRHAACIPQSGVPCRDGTFFSVGPYANPDGSGDDDQYDKAKTTAKR